MNSLIEISENLIARTQVKTIRSIMQTINWKARLIGIQGARGIGKTTLLLQYIKLNLKDEMGVVLYASLDDVWFNSHTLTELVRTFSQKGGVYLFLDEVHKYANWRQEIKNAYDQHPNLKIVFTGSSLLEIQDAKIDLSRRAIIYRMQGLSFREFLNIETGISFSILNLTEILKNHTKETRIILEKIKPFQYFETYLRSGYYPFYNEERTLYLIRLNNIVNLMLEVELPLLRKVEIGYVTKLKQLLSIIAQSVPFSVNTSKLSEKMKINRNTLLAYLHYLDEVNLTTNLFKKDSGLSLLQKPMKIYLENTNLMYLLGRERVNNGNIRETFFANQVKYNHEINHVQQTDFLINNKYYFEVGGRNKGHKQTQGIHSSYLVKDDIEIGRGDEIPLWLFGFLY